MGIHVAECATCMEQYEHKEARAVAQWVILHGGWTGHLNFLADEATHSIVARNDIILPTAAELGLET